MDAGQEVGELSTLGVPWTETAEAVVGSIDFVVGDSVVGAAAVASAVAAAEFAGDARVAVAVAFDGAEAPVVVLSQSVRHHRQVLHARGTPSELGTESQDSTRSPSWQNSVPSWASKLAAGAAESEAMFEAPSVPKWEEN